MMGELHIAKGKQSSYDNALIVLGKLIFEYGKTGSNKLIKDYESYYEPHYPEYASMAYVEKYDCRVYYEE